MLKSLLKSEKGIRAAVPQLALQIHDCGLPAVSGFQRDYAQLVDIFRKEKVAERKQKLKEECTQGYFDDFKELKDHGGKIFQASSLIRADAATALPPVQVNCSDGSMTSLTREAEGCAVSLLCVGFRGGAEEMLASWSRRFSEGQHVACCQHLELSIVESVVMSWWPFKGIILKGKSKAAEAAALRPAYFFHFNRLSPFISALQLSNRLTGYVFLIDRKGRVRWRGSGMASDGELERMMRSVSSLVQEHKADSSNPSSIERHPAQ